MLGLEAAHITQILIAAIGGMVAFWGGYFAWRGRGDEGRIKTLEGQLDRCREQVSELLGAHSQIVKDVEECRRDRDELKMRVVMLEGALTESRAQIARLEQENRQQALEMERMKATAAQQAGDFRGPNSN
jgi:chromosome segregation ATPase